MPRQRPLSSRADVLRGPALAVKPALVSSRSSPEARVSPPSSTILAWLEKCIALALSAVVFSALLRGYPLALDLRSLGISDNGSSCGYGCCLQAALISWRTWGLLSSPLLAVAVAFTAFVAVFWGSSPSGGQRDIFLGAVAPVLLLSALASALGEPAAALGQLFPPPQEASFSPSTLPVALSGAVMPSYSAGASSAAIAAVTAVGTRVVALAVALAALFLVFFARRRLSVPQTLGCLVALAAAAMAAPQALLFGTAGAAAFASPFAAPVAIGGIAAIAIGLWALLCTAAPLSLSGSEAVSVSLLAAAPLWLALSVTAGHTSLLIGGRMAHTTTAQLLPQLFSLSLPPLRAALIVAVVGAVFAASTMTVAHFLGLRLLPAAAPCPTGPRAYAGRILLVVTVITVLPVCYSLVWLGLGSEPIAWLVAFLLAPAPALAPLAEALGVVAGCVAKADGDCGTIGAAVVAMVVAPRIWLFGFCLIVAGVGVAIAFATSNSPVNCDSPSACQSLSPESNPIPERRTALTVIRKWYHLLAVLVLAPPVLLDLGFASLALAGALALFLLAEAIRGPRLPPLGTILQSFVSFFTDERDSGELVLTHIYLLLGCSIPVWVTTALLPPPLAPPAPALAAGPLSGPAAGPWLGAINAAWTTLGLLASTSSPGGVVSVPALWSQASAVAIEPWWAPEVPASGAVASLAGLVVLGVGDSVASIVGTAVGGIRWPGSKKTLSGTAAAAVATAAVVVVAMEGLGRGGARSPHALLNDARTWAAAALGAVTALAEAATEHIDNLFLPVLFLAGIAAVLPGAIGEST